MIVHYLPEFIEEGIYDFRVQAKDVAGNRSGDLHHRKLQHLDGKVRHVAKQPDVAQNSGRMSGGFTDGSAAARRLTIPSNAALFNA